MRLKSEAALQEAGEKLREDQIQSQRTRERLLEARKNYNELIFATQKAEEHTKKLEDTIKVRIYKLERNP